MTLLFLTVAYLIMMLGLVEGFRSVLGFIPMDRSMICFILKVLDLGINMHAVFFPGHIKIVPLSEFF